MVLACGIDIEDHTRFLKFFREEEPAHFFHSIYSPRETENYASFNTPLCHALSFSCKEAFFKAFSQAFDQQEMDWSEVELIFHDEPTRGKSSLNFRGHLLELAQKHRLRLPPAYSYSISDSLVVFETVLECPQN